MTDCAKLRENYEAYALGALDPEDRTEIEAHLARNCLVCTPEIERARWLVSQLAYLAPEAEPPSRVRDRILEAARAKAPEERRVWLPVWAWAGMAALLVLSVYAARQARVLQERATRLEAQVRRERARNQAMESERLRYQQAVAVFAAQDTREVKLKAARADWPEVHAYWHPQMGLVLTGQKVPAPAADRTFQLWLVPKKGTPISAGIFRPDASGEVFLVSIPKATLAEAAALAITDEPSGGSTTPSLPPVWAGPVII